MTTMGVGIGMFFTSYCLVVVEVLGLSLLTPMLSISGVFKGASVTFFGPLIGKCYLYFDVTNKEKAVTVVSVRKCRDEKQ